MTCTQRSPGGLVFEPVVASGGTVVRRTTRERTRRGGAPGGNTIAPGGYAEVPFRKEAAGRRSRGKSRPVRPMGPAPGVPDGGKPEYAAKPRAPGGRLRELKTPRAKGGIPAGVTKRPTAGGSPVADRHRNAGSSGKVLAEPLKKPGGLSRVQVYEFDSASGKTAPDRRRCRGPVSMYSLRLKIIPRRQGTQRIHGPDNKIPTRRASVRC